jgi:paraquat-inducible protein A
MIAVASTARVNFLTQKSGAGLSAHHLPSNKPGRSHTINPDMHGIAESNLTQTACAECDLLLAIPDIEEREQAACPRCGHLLTQRPRHGLERVAACAIAGCVFLAISLFYPFLAFSSSGVENVMTLPNAAVSIYEHQGLALSIIMFVAIIGAPLALLGGMIALTLPLISKRPAPWLKATAKLVFSLQSWNMVEVFIIAVIVSLVKISHLATVIIGMSFWSYILFAFCLTAALSGLDRLQVWHAIEVQTV